MPPKSADKNLIGTDVFLEPTEGLLVRCKVTHAKKAYGRRLLEIQPLAGKGRAWVNATSVRPCEASNAEGGK
jgi:hypothetical protein